MKLMPDVGRAMAAAFKADRARQTVELALPSQGQRSRTCPCTRCNGDHPAAVCPRQAAAGRRPRVSDRQTPP